jgi:hypothetical protein
MHIQALWPRVEQAQVFFHLTDPTNGAFKDAFYKHSLLGMDHLVVARLQLSVNVNVLYVEAC